MGMLEAFQRYCKQQGITSGQYQNEIWLVWQAGYRSALSTRLIKEVVAEDARSRAEADLGEADLDDGC